MECTGNNMGSTINNNVNSLQEYNRRRYSYLVTNKPWRTLCISRVVNSPTLSYIESGRTSSCENGGRTPLLNVTRVDAVNQGSEAEKREPVESHLKDYPTCRRSPFLLYSTLVPKVTASDCCQQCHEEDPPPFPSPTILRRSHV